MIVFPGNPHFIHNPLVVFIDVRLHYTYLFHLLASFQMKSKEKKKFFSYFFVDLTPVEEPTVPVKKGEIIPVDVGTLLSLKLVSRPPSIDVQKLL